MEIDSLTGFYDLKTFLSEAHRLIQNKDVNYAMLDIDLSNFKYLNDFYGMDEGDRVISDMADYFFKSTSNFCIGYRTMGDQFRALVTTNNFTEDEMVDHIVARNKEFERIMLKRYPNLYLHVYSGIYFITNRDEDIRRAIDKSHFAKKSIKGNFDITCKVYREWDFKENVANMRVINEFEQAIVNDNIVVYLQPKMRVSDHKLIGAEALARIIDSSGQIMSPAIFIPVLEQTGMIGRLDDIILEKTFQLMNHWQKSNYAALPVSVNLSRLQFSKSDLADKIIYMSEKYEIDPSLVELEITETIFIECLDEVSAIVMQLRLAGFTISVDDFGSGYSSLSLISSIPADVIKLDSSFAKKSLKSVSGRKIVESIVSMLKNINFDVICEGIETQEDENIIYEFGCDKIQGYLYDKPIPALLFEEKYLNV